MTDRIPRMPGPSQASLRLARALAGIQSAQPPPPVQTADFRQPGGQGFAGPEPMMPPMPGGQGYGGPEPMMPAAPSMQGPPPQQPPMPMAGGQGYGGPEPAGMPPPYDPNMDPRYLPEQWRGAYNNWQFPT